MMMSAKTSKSAFGRFSATSNGAVVFIQTQLKWHKF
jgi:ribosomal protein L35